MVFLFFFCEATVTVRTEPEVLQREEKLAVTEAYLLEMSAVFKFTNRQKLLWYGKFIRLLNLFQREFLMSGCVDRVLEVNESFACAALVPPFLPAHPPPRHCSVLEHPVFITFLMGKFIAQFNMLLIL